MKETSYSYPHDIGRKKKWFAPHWLRMTFVNPSSSYRRAASALVVHTQSYGRAAKREKSSKRQ